ncbi:26s proteasome regulatory subunit, putative [Candida dubliniensis CD36]|uniref:26s proteasome regulatory subunit, putative n=1 Tax=Candida dubliniensis (strain CD36 / ATCC MYA-646 / CBS 7987 / NCPF 3949 / NRRL Y-17841) TaxID=573826 RepID=B9WCG8_CANDC|nr:26s proteasome regulatory subunit, putative [Candida dubliniensis CD36]CAX44090.1 26s proteasome regulatory subunit, putative [Candida dubliniensis CD36]
MSLQKLTAELYSLFAKEDYQGCQQLLAPIKLELVKHDLLVPLPSNTTDKNQINDLRIAQRILEIGALSSLLTNNYSGFENYFAQLRPFYANPKLHNLQKVHINTDITKITSLYLLYLLSQGLISKFHVELEVIYNSSQYDVQQDKYLQFPINLESNLMEGNYIKIWKLLKEEKNLPCQEYTHFVDTLINALRFEIAKSLEKTYDSIPISNCKNLLYLPQELSDSNFEKTLKETYQVDNWKFEDGVIYFAKNENETDADNQSVIKNLLGYAEQIESIV